MRREYYREFKQMSATIINSPENSPLEHSAQDLTAGPEAATLPGVTEEVSAREKHLGLVLENFDHATRLAAMLPAMRDDSAWKAPVLNRLEQLELNLGGRAPIIHALPLARSEGDRVLASCMMGTGIRKLQHWTLLNRDEALEMASAATEPEQVQLRFSVLGLEGERREEALTIAACRNTLPQSVMSERLIRLVSETEPGRKGADSESARSAEVCHFIESAAYDIEHSPFLIARGDQYLSAPLPFDSPIRSGLMRVAEYCRRYPESADLLEGPKIDRAVVQRQAGLVEELKAELRTSKEGVANDLLRSVQIEARFLERAIERYDAGRMPGLSRLDAEHKNIGGYSMTIGANPVIRLLPNGTFDTIRTPNQKTAFSLAKYSATPANLSLLLTRTEFGVYDFCTTDGCPLLGNAADEARAMFDAVERGIPIFVPKEANASVAEVVESAAEKAQGAGGKRPVEPRSWGQKFLSQLSTEEPIPGKLFVSGGHWMIYRFGDYIVAEADETGNASYFGTTEAIEVFKATTREELTKNPPSCIVGKPLVHRGQDALSRLDWCQEVVDRLQEMGALTGAQKAKTAAISEGVSTLGLRS